MALAIFETTMFICLAIFAGIGVWSLKREDPMHFWSGSRVPPENITDIKRYNKANAVMWFCFCIPMVISMIIAPFSIIAAGITMVVGFIPGFIFVIIAYQRILNKYLVPGSEPYEEA